MGSEVTLSAINPPVNNGAQFCLVTILVWPENKSHMNKKNKKYENKLGQSCAKLRSTYAGQPDG